MREDSDEGNGEPDAQGARGAQRAGVIATGRSEDRKGGVPAQAALRSLPHGAKKDAGSPPGPIRPVISVSPCCLGEALWEIAPANKDLCRIVDVRILRTTGRNITEVASRAYRSVQSGKRLISLPALQAMKHVVVLLVAFVLLAAADRGHHSRRREVLLQQGRTIDTRSAVRASSDAAHQALAAKFDQATEHQYIVHVSGPITDAKKTAIESAAKVKLLHYIPHNSFIVAARSDQLAALEAAPGVLWVGAFQPEYKMPKQVVDWEKNKLAGASATDMFVLLHSKLSDALLRSRTSQWAHELRKETGITALFRVIRNNKLRVSVPGIKAFSKVALWLAHRPLVHWIEPTFDYETHAYAGGTGLIETNSTSHASILAAAGTQTPRPRVVQH